MLVCWGVLLNLLNFASSHIESDISYYLNLVRNTRKHAVDFQLPTSAKDYQAFNEPIEFGSFDFLIIGGGSGGSTMANRLSEMEDFSVLLLEAGNFGNDITSVPVLANPSKYTHFNWGFRSVPQKGACQGMVDKKCGIPRGRGIGGTSLINYMYYIRGDKWYYDKWAEIVNDSRWSYEKVLPYFIREEKLSSFQDELGIVESKYHGKKGELFVEFRHPKSAQLKYWLDANTELGYPPVDYNANKMGPSPIQFNMLNGRRWDVGTAFLRPIMHRKNLTVMTDSYVTKIGINPKTKIVEKVYFSRENKNYVVNVRLEAILCAGSIQTPQLLMLSGVGPKKHLKKLKIPLIFNQPLVGSTLRDHPMIPLVFNTNFTQPNQTDKEIVQEFLNGKGLYTYSDNMEALSFTPSRYGIPDTEIVIRPANQDLKTLFQHSYSLTNETFNAIFGKSNVQNAFLLQLAAVHTHSLGTLRLKTANPYDYPIINPKYLSDPADHDVNVIYDAIQYVLRLIKTKALKKINTKLATEPFEQCKHYPYLSKDYWYCALRVPTINFCHAMSTCQMGKNSKYGVVNSEGVVFGIENLRIADASIFPLTMGGHPNAIVIMAADVISDFIKDKYCNSKN